MKKAKRCEVCGNVAEADPKVVALQRELEKVEEEQKKLEEELHKLNVKAHTLRKRLAAAEK